MSSFLMNPVAGNVTTTTNPNSSYHHNNLHPYIQQAAHHGHQVESHQHLLSMTPISTMDPKFPPNDDYSNGDYICNSTDFFPGHLINHSQSHLQYSGYHNQPNTGLTSHYDHSTTYNNTSNNYNSYYQTIPPLTLPPHSCGSVITDISNTCSSDNLVKNRQQSSISPSLESLTLSQQQQPQSLRLTNSDLVVHDNVNDPNDCDRLIVEDSPIDEDDEEDDDDYDSENGDRIIYPWMKKIHVAGVGKSSFN